MASEKVFVTVSHPSQLSLTENKRRVASHIGIYHRNRSRPSKRSGPWIHHVFTQTQSLRDGDSMQGYDVRRIPHDYHGIRVDPFASHPGKATKAVPGAIDHYFSFLAPTHIIRVGKIRAAPSPSLVRRYFRYMMEKPLLFEATVAIAQLSATANGLADRNECFETAPASTVDNAALYHYGQAIMHLRDLIEDPVLLTEDATLLAIASLVGFDFLLDNTTALEIHLRGLQQILKLRKGCDSYEWSNILEPMLDGIAMFSTYIFRHDVRKEELTDSPATVATTLGNADKFERNAMSLLLDSETMLIDSTRPDAMIRNMSPTTIAHLVRTLPEGFYVLACQSPNGLSKYVILLLYCIATTDTLLNHVSLPENRLSQRKKRFMVRQALSKFSSVNFARNLKVDFANAQTSRDNLCHPNLYSMYTLANTRYTQNLPSSYWRREGVALRKTHHNTSNLQILEFTVKLLNDPSLTSIERSICLGVLMTLMESSRIERLSQGWRRQCEMMSSHMLRVLGGTEWDKMNWNERHCSVWAAMDIAGSFVAPRLQKFPQHSTMNEIDTRLQVAARIRQAYGRGYNGLEFEWEEMEAILKRFFWTDGCRSSWKNIWFLAEHHLNTEAQARHTQVQA